MKSGIMSIAIPAYRNPGRLQRCLESIQRIDSDWLSQTVVVDDSGDGQVAQKLGVRFPQITWIVHESNRGFAAAANTAIGACKSEYALLLNDDSELLSDPREVLLCSITKPDVFAVSLESVNETGEHREGAKKIVWRFGIAKVLHNERDQVPPIDGVQFSDYAVGGHAVYNVTAFRELGGFDRMFHPFYWEDADLCARARAKGWTVIYSPKAQVLHRTDGAIRSTQSIDAVRRATWRNRLLYSRRHVRGIQAILQPFGMAWFYVKSIAGADTVLKEAFSEYRETLRNDTFSS